MCGHVGIAGDLAYKDEATMKRLLLLDYFRGTDSTGMAAYRDSGEVAILKAAVNPIDFFDLKRFDKLNTGHSSQVFLGHNRAATRGVVNNVNAHPFEHEHIVGAHNGTLDPSSFSDIKDKIGMETGTDSEAIIICIAKFGIEETVKLMRGAWALVWIDTNKKTLNFLRNKERPFWYAFEKGCKRIFWASQFPMIRAAVDLAKENQGYELYRNDKDFCFFSTGENWWYEYDLPTLKKGSEKPPKARAKELKPPEKKFTPVTNYYGGNYSGYNGGGTHNGPFNQNSTTTSTTTRGQNTGTRGPRFHHITVTDADPFGSVLEPDEFDKITRHGCSWCAQELRDDSPGMAVYVEDNAALCKDCSTHGSDIRIYTNTSNPILNSYGEESDGLTEREQLEFAKKKLKKDK